jgi:hypothetical protein
LYLKPIGERVQLKDWETGNTIVEGTIKGYCFYQDSGDKMQYGYCIEIDRGGYVKGFEDPGKAMHVSMIIVHWTSFNESNGDTYMRFTSD